MFEVLENRLHLDLEIKQIDDSLPRGLWHYYTTTWTRRHSNCRSTWIRRRQKYTMSRNRR